VEDAKKQLEQAEKSKVKLDLHVKKSAEVV